MCLKVGPHIGRLCLVVKLACGGSGINVATTSSSKSQRAVNEIVRARSNNMQEQSKIMRKVGLHELTYHLL